MPRKSRKKQDLETVKEATGLTSAADLPAPETTAPPAYRPSFVEKLRPSGPRRRDPHEPANVFTSPNARIDKDGQVYGITLSSEPDADTYASLQRAGFDDVTEHDTGKQWVGYQSELNRMGTDINRVAYGLKQGRGR